MRILSIETSCDETAVSVVAAEGNFPKATYKILGNALCSQIDIHREYGGVFPAVAKREHAKALVPMLESALQEAKLLEARPSTLTQEQTETLYTLLNREPGLTEQLSTFFEIHAHPQIDLIAVTTGPGLEPALWVGINFARSLAYLWDVPLVPVNHMEGHVLSSLFTGSHIADIEFPALVLLISGGHTQLVLMKDWVSYDVVGETRDDAVGEAFDKIARMLGLPYPGGPEISLRAERARKDAETAQNDAETNQHESTSRSQLSALSLPRPMIDTDNFDFSFSGLKTAVRYAIEGKTLSESEIASIAREFEDAVTDVLLEKTRRAVDKHGIKTLIIGGGVSANAHIRAQFSNFFKTEYPDIDIYFPQTNLSTDNSIMIALAGHAHVQHARTYRESINLTADGNLDISLPID